MYKDIEITEEEAPTKASTSNRIGGESASKNNFSKKAEHVKRKNST